MKYLNLTPASGLILGLLVLVAATGGILLALAIAPGESRDPLEILDRNMAIYSKNSAAMWRPPPETMNDLLDKSGVIVVGTVDSVVRSGALKSYNEADNARVDKYLDELKDAGEPLPNIYPPYTDYLITVDTVFLDDGTIDSEKPLILRMLGRHGMSSSANETPSILSLPNIGDKRLFTLSANPDGMTYGLHGWWSHFVTDGDKVTYSDDLRTPIGFTDKVKPDDFFKELQAAIDRSN